VEQIYGSVRALKDSNKVSKGYQWLGRMVRQRFVSNQNRVAHEKLVLKITQVVQGWPSRRIKSVGMTCRDCTQYVSTTHPLVVNKVMRL
jgi:hypothetical protein